VGGGGGGGGGGVRDLLEGSGGKRIHARREDRIVSVGILIRLFFKCMWYVCGHLCAYGVVCCGMGAVCVHRFLFVTKRDARVRVCESARARVFVRLCVRVYVCVGVFMCPQM